MRDPLGPREWEFALSLQREDEMPLVRWGPALSNRETEATSLSTGRTACQARWEQEPPRHSKETSDSRQPMQDRLRAK